MSHHRVVLLLVSVICLIASTVIAEIDYSIYLNSGTIRTGSMRTLPMAAAATLNRHLLVQFESPLTDEQRMAMADDGLILQQYVPNFAFVILATEPLTAEKMHRYGIRWVDYIQPDHKMSSLLRAADAAPWALRDGDSIQVTAVFHRDESLTSAADNLRNAHGARVLGSEPTTHSLDVILPRAELVNLPQMEQLLFVEPALPEPIEDNNSSRQNLNVDAVQAAPYGLNGSGVLVAEWDGGRVDGSHPDFGGRVISADSSVVATHATHVAGTVMGSGASSSGTYKGMAPGAQLLTKRWFGSISEAFTDYQFAIGTYGARVSQNSWGYGPGDPATQSACEELMGNYWTISAAIDNIVRGDAGAPIIAVWAAGNQRGSSSSYCGSIGWTFNTTDPLANAKNVIAVGAINSNNSTMTSFSSWGPTDDGRVKPDVVGPGCQSSSDYGVTSTKPTSGYTVMCGTSMAAPAISGVVALVLQRHDQLFPSDTLLASTVKGILINSAIDLGNIGPDYQYGHGKVDALAAIRKVSVGEPSYVQEVATTGSVAYFDLTLPTGASRIRVTLVWDDPGSSAIAGSMLVNDLDLRLIAPDQTEYSPWVLNWQAPGLPAVRGDDHANNVETVDLTNPPAGTWRAKVTGFNVPQGPQKYSLIFTPDSIFTAGSFHSLAVADYPDTIVTPGDSARVNFQISNLGSADSVTVRFADSSGWMVPREDATLSLGPNASAIMAAWVKVPLGGMYGQSDVVTCAIQSRADTTISSQISSRILAKRLYGVSVAMPAADSSGSPSTLSLAATVTNSGNATDNFIVSVANDSAWTTVPVAMYLSVPPGRDSTISVTLTVPSEVPSHSINRLVVKATSSGGMMAADTTQINISGSLATPSLLSPEQVVYSRERQYTYVWQGVADSFSVYVATDSLLLSLVRTYRGIMDTTFVLPASDSLLDGAYFWGVRGFLGTDSSALQRHVRKIYVDNRTPSMVTPVAPISGFVTTQSFVIDVALVGSVPKVAPEFGRIQMCPDSLFNTGTVAFDSVVPLQYTITQGIPDGRWYWRACRYDLAGNVSGWSPRADFLLDTQAPAKPDLIAPSDGTQSGGSSILLDWTANAASGHEQAAEYFHVQVSKNPGFTDYTTFNRDVVADSVILPTSLLADGKPYYWQVKGLDSAGHQSPTSTPRYFVWYNFVCGDLDRSSGVDIGDLTAMIQYLFLGGPAPQLDLAASINCDRSIDISDLTWMITFLFLSGPEPCCQ